MLLGLTGRWAAPTGGRMRKRSEKRTCLGEIRHYRRVYTHRMQESLVGHKGRDIEERVDSWVLQQVPHSALVRDASIISIT